MRLVIKTKNYDEVYETLKFLNEKKILSNWRYECAKNDCEEYQKKNRKIYQIKLYDSLINKIDMYGIIYMYEKGLFPYESYLEEEEECIAQNADAQTQQ